MIAQGRGVVYEAVHFRIDDTDNIYVHAHAHMHCMTTTISLTKEAYEALVRLKRNDESFSELILRIAKEEERIWDYFGSIPLTQKEERDIMQSIDRLKKQMNVKAEH